MKWFFRKLLVLVLSAALVFSLAVPSFAVVNTGNEGVILQPTKTYSEGGCENGELNYLAFGDSMTNGFGLAGYDTKGEKATNPEKHEGFKFAVEGAYPDIFASKLNTTFGYKVNLFQYAFTATRVEDVLALISSADDADANYYGGDSFTNSYIIDQRMDKMYGNEVLTTPINDKRERSLAKFEYAKKDFTAAVQKANLISVCLGMNTFVCYLRERINAWSGGLIDGETVGRGAFDLSTVLSPEAKSLYDKLDEALVSVLGKQLDTDAKIAPDLVSDIFGDSLYGLASLGVNYKKICNRIYELNPDADIMLIGFPYAIKDAFITIDVPVGNRSYEVNLDFGKLADAVTYVINTFIKAQAVSYKGNAVYVDYGDVDLIFQDIAKLKMGGSVDLSNEYEYRLLTSTLGTMFKDIGQKLVNAIAAENVDSIKTYSLENVKKGLAYTQGETSDYAAYAIPGQVSLGIRDAIIDMLNYNDKNKYHYVNAVKAIDYLISDGKSAYDALLTGAVLNGLKDAAKKVNKPAVEGSDVKDQSLREEVRKVLETDGSADLIFVYARLLMDNSYTSHTSASGHIQVANRVFAGYEKLQKIKRTKQVIKKTVPVLVGGSAVTLIAASVFRSMMGGKK